jgi:hypothetical protein
MFKFVILGLLLTSHCAYGAFWSACAGTGMKAPVNIVSALCSDVSCVATRGGDMSGQIFIAFTSSHSNLIASARAFLGGNWVNIPVTPPEACPQMSPGCPTQAGTTHVWNMNIPLDDTVPAFQNSRVQCE